VFHPRGFVRTTTTDGEIGGRAQLGVSYRGKVGLLAGIGYRDINQLKSGGRVIAPATGETQKVPPAFEDDGKTQKGTGFEELTSDARLVWEADPKVRLTFGYYDYRQFDVPRTDRCPPPTAPEDECLRYPEQFRTLVYTAVDAGRGPAAVEDLRWTLSFQNQHERRELERGFPSDTEVHGRDDVYTVGTSARLNTKEFVLAPWVALQVLYGIDLYYDRVSSVAWQHYRDVDIVSYLSRGQYVDDANYLTSGVWTEVQTTFWDAVRLRAGGRGALVYAQGNEDVESETAAVDRHWLAAVGNAGVSAQAVPWLSFLFNVDQGFRAPNLDDLTSRQQTGPGFQFESSTLEPERSIGLEAGTKVESRWVELYAWVFRTYVYDLIARAPRTADECPEGDPGCMASQTRFQLVNLDGRAIIQGVEGDLRVYLPLDLHARATISFARGEGPNPVPRPTDPNASYRDRLPLSRIPPLHGTVEAGWRSSRFGFHLIGALRWATAQTRLALADQADARIPEGGTPGYVVFDVRAGYRWDPHLLLGMVFENVSDAAYRHHGSSINGPGRGLMAYLEFGW
jgi:iron complex outermembrane receptor protein/hemoglobin/transferrin/lactoferrin receptor protein